MTGTTNLFGTFMQLMESLFFDAAIVFEDLFWQQKPATIKKSIKLNV
jgi:hypothetical protein